MARYDLLSRRTFLSCWIQYGYVRKNMFPEHLFLSKHTSYAVDSIKNTWYMLYSFHNFSNSGTPTPDPDHLSPRWRPKWFAQPETRDLARKREAIADKLRPPRGLISINRFAWFKYPDQREQSKLCRLVVVERGLCG